MKATALQMDRLRSHKYGIESHYCPWDYDSICEQSHKEEDINFLIGMMSIDDELLREKYEIPLPPDYVDTTNISIQK